MDKRQIKTLDSILASFEELINTTKYEDITIQNILDTSKVSRSTFYSHFKTKDDLLGYISNHIFDHVFSHTLQEEKSHDFSKDALYDYRHLITHIFYHIKDEKKLITGILNSTGNNLFLEGFRKHLVVLVDTYYNNYKLTNLEIPLDLKKAIVIESFIVILKYWINDDCNKSPEEITSFFLATI